jgi:hypothetical protein
VESKGHRPSAGEDSDRHRIRALRDRDPRRKLDEEFEPFDRMGGGELDLGRELVTLDQPVAVDAHGRAQIGIGRLEQAEPEQEQERGAQRRELRPANDEGGDQRDTAERGIRGELR